MNFGFDIDGTITHSPKAFGAIMESLMRCGHQVHVLTGTMDPAITQGHYTARHKQLAACGVAGKYHHLHIVIAPHPQNKASYCQLHNIVMMFEDSPSYADAIKKVTTCLLIQ